VKQDRDVVHKLLLKAKDARTFGEYEVTHDITKYTKAAIFGEVGKKTEMFVRFSTVAGERGAADAERDIRGFAMRFYTEEGNWDLEIGRASCREGMCSEVVYGTV